jgi:uncharacterized membrane protein YhfC
MLGVLPLTIGPFFIGSMWILKYKYGRFWKYMGLNFVVDSAFVYLLMKWLCFFIKSALMYAVQSLVEKMEMKKSRYNRDLLTLFYVCFQ